MAYIYMSGGAPRAMARYGTPLRADEIQRKFASGHPPMGPVGSRAQLCLAFFPFAWRSFYVTRGRIGFERKAMCRALHTAREDVFRMLPKPRTNSRRLRQFASGMHPT